MPRKTIADAAIELGIDVPGAGMRRWRSELLIARLLRAHACVYRVPAAAMPGQRETDSAPQPAV
jgi:hypothetical protein